MSQPILFTNEDIVAQVKLSTKIPEIMAKQNNSTILFSVTNKLKIIFYYSLVKKRQMSEIYCLFPLILNK